MDKKVLKRTITDEEMLALSTKVGKMFPDELYATLGLYTAIVMADIFEDSEEENKEVNNDHKVFATYKAGKWEIEIYRWADYKARLVIYYSGEKRIDRIVDSIYKAYNYAFNIICKDK